MGPPSNIQSVVGRNVVMLRMTNIYCFSTATVVTRRSRFVTLCVHCLSCCGCLRHVFTCSTYLPFLTASSYRRRF